jgi:nicotinamidase-related amidase
MLFFDTLNVYLHPKDPERQAAANDVIKTMVRINEACRKAGIAIFYGQADHRPDGKDFAPHIVEKEIRGRKPVAAFRTVPPTMVAGSWEHEIIPELAAQPGDYVIKKHRWSTFFQTHLSQISPPRWRRQGQQAGPRAGLMFSDSVTPQASLSQAPRGGRSTPGRRARS